MPLYSDDNRLLKLTTPLGKDALLVLGFKGVERVSGMFEFVLDLVGERGSAADFSQVVGKEATLEINASGTADVAPGKRKINGIVTRFSLSGAITSVQSAPGRNIDFLHYSMVLSPIMWHLTRAADNRIFQDKAGKDIVEAVLKGRGISNYALSVASALSRSYCVQFAETDFAFVSRLLEDEGIYYWFDHDDSGHKLNISDTKGGGPVCGPAAGIKFRPGGTGTGQGCVITAWSEERTVTTAKYALQSYNFETPATDLTSSVQTTVTVGVNNNLERYDYANNYGTVADGTTRVKFRIEGQEAEHQRFHGESNCAFLIAGRTFRLVDHVLPGQNADYTLLEVTHEARNNGYAVFLDDEEPFYGNRFECMRKDVQYRPPLTTPHPRMHGVQSALVVGPSAEEIYTDKYGRIKVQFFWDRNGSKDESSSCWMRVAQSWASNMWGAQFIPRVGQEVLVDFIDGDPDQPLVTGALYNAQKMPPYALPDNKTQSGVKSRSSKEGGADNFNELRFEDLKGSEDINFQAEKDFHRLVKNDDFLDVQHDQTIKVKNARTETVAEGDETVTVSKGNRAVTISEGNETLTVSKGNRLVAVSQGDDTHTVDTGKRVVQVQGNDQLTVKQGDRVITVSQGKDDTTVAMGDSKLTVSQGNREVTVSLGNDNLTVSTGNHAVKVNVGKSSTTATGGIELTVGANSIKIDQAGITISGMTVKIQGSIQTQIQGAMTQINGDATVMVQGGVIMIG